MADEIHLRGLAWDHKRCWGPLDASVATYCASHPGVRIKWDRRSLWEFGEGRLEGPVASYDLIIYDHPFVGEAARDGKMIDLATLLSDRQSASFASDSLGPSWRSYRYDGGIWALPIDAAAQVAAYRSDLLCRYVDAPPRTYEDVVSLGEAVRADGLFLGWPSVPTDVMCTILTVAAGMGFLPARQAPFLAANELAEVMTVLRRLRSLAHPLSGTWNPIACYDHMVAQDDVVYVPYGFGYVNYASPANHPRLMFANIPGIHGPEAVGGLLGGAGVGISARSANPAAAFDYAMFLCHPDFQAGDYVRQGGQPGSLAAWNDPNADAVAGGFFSATRETLENAYLRPNAPGFVDFFRRAADLATAHLADGDGADDDRLADQLNSCFETSLAGAVQTA